LYEIDEHKVVATAQTCAKWAGAVHGTIEGNVLALCPTGLVLYDRTFRTIAHFEIALGGYDILLSPTHQFIALNPRPRQGVARVLSTANLTEVANFPPISEYVIEVFREGYMVYGSEKGEEGWKLIFRHFSGSHATVLAHSGKACAQVGFGVSESQFLELACGKESKAEIIDLTSGKGMPLPSISGSADFVKAASSGQVFALASLGYSKAHSVKQIVNPLTYVEALGACCDDPSNLLDLRIFTRSGMLLKSMQWKIKKKERKQAPYSPGLALSPNGEYLAVRHGKSLEIYRTPAAESR
jgi:hypothetical protein